MKARTKTEFTVVTPVNVREVSQTLKRGEGRILIATPTYSSYPRNYLWGEFEMHLYDRPQIHPNKQLLCAPRGTRKVGNQEFQTGWERDRAYRLTEAPRQQPTQCALTNLYRQANGFFNRLSIGDRYLFEAHMQAYTGFYFSYRRHRTLYIPRSVSPRAGIRHALSWMTTLWNVQKPLEGHPERFRFEEDHLATIIEYILADLKTGDALMHNVGAGQAADSFIGL